MVSTPLVKSTVQLLQLYVFTEVYMYTWHADIYWKLLSVFPLLLSLFILFFLNRIVDCCCHLRLKDEDVTLWTSISYVKTAMPRESRPCLLKWPQSYELQYFIMPEAFHGDSYLWIPHLREKFLILQIDLFNLCNQLLGEKLFLHLDVHVFIK